MSDKREIKIEGYIPEELLSLPEDQIDAFVLSEGPIAFKVARLRYWVDMLLCAVAFRRQIAIYTTDSDFINYARVLPLKLHSPRQVSAREN